MARLFSGDTQHLEISSAVISSEPISFACWLWMDSISENNNMIVIGDSAGPDLIRMHAHGSAAGDKIKAQAYDGTSSGIAETTTGFSATTWTHTAAVFTSDSSRSVYIDGGSKGTDTTAVTASGMDNTRLSGYNADSVTVSYDGRLAEFGVWNVALTDAEVASLASGFSPLMIRPDGLVAYWPLIGRTSPEIDVVGGFDMTLINSPTTAAHPSQIFYPVPDLSYIHPPALYSNRASTDPGTFDRWIMASFFIDEITSTVAPVAPPVTEWVPMEPKFVRQPIPIGIFDI